MSGQIILRDVILKHDIPVTTKWGVTHVLIFYNPKDNTTWAWKTTTLPQFDEHNTYSIIAVDEGDFNISHVRNITSAEVDPEDSATVKSEQPLSAKDIDYFDKLLTLDYKYDIISVKGGSQDV